MGDWFIESGRLVGLCIHWLRESVSGGMEVPHRRKRRHRKHVHATGTEGSNPSPSTGESATIIVLRVPIRLSADYRDILQAAAIIQSMSRKGNCWDDAPTESFFGTLRTELVHHCEYPDRDTARRDLFAYIEGYYNRRRIHSAIGYITPQQAEAKYA
jgi:hypothetical protein